MLNSKKLIPIALCAMVAAPAPAFAGAWTAKKGSAYNKFAINTFDSSALFGTQEEGFEEFTDLNFTFYGEYGITDDLTFFGSAALKRITRTDFGVQVTNEGVGDVDLGLRYNFYNDDFVFSGQFLFKAPYLYDEDADLPLGNGQEDYEFRLLFGKTLGRLGYFGAEAGYRFRAGDPVDEFRYLIEYGFDVTDNVYLRAKLDGTLNAQSGDNLVDTTSANPALPLAFDLGKLETTAGWKINDNFVGEFTVTSNIYGDNTLRGTNFQFAVVYSF
ncbi:hypothetical protein [Kordiimonas sp. SCSIO 12610]|uniref:hypothetical protein n=1 Tax=Kordiimonas sp. SCSIO 12610 TaxID=2829597 RepID=UPI00210A16AC|nr:hypothetical protein [Kordiimonas sp. SCSIO 12610]UTW54340.1 hypothetical protein KFF44_11000 [Kordiimonas sp. SCSIO 12610]